MPRQRPSRGWRRTSKPATADRVRDNLDRRLLQSLEDCRLAWERSADPLAVCVAVMKVPEIPEWLADAVLALLFEGGTVTAAPPYTTLLAKAWAHRIKDEVDARRALGVAVALTHPGPPDTWIEALRRGEQIARTAGLAEGVIEPRSAATAQKSYNLVRAGLEANPGRYFSPDDAKLVKARRNAAIKRFREIIEMLVVTD
jgi:hypothetical protein